MTRPAQSPRPYGRRLEIASAHRPFLLEAGQSLGPLVVEYETWGTLNSEASNGILVCHALTGNAHAARHSPDDEPGWWDGLIGPGASFDTDRYFVVCSNILGSCYGTTGPVSRHVRAGKPYGTTFPPVSVRDMVRVQASLLKHLGVRRLAAVAGGSLGGMQVLEWAVMYPHMVERIIPIATASRHSAWCIALNEASRLAIVTDPGWKDGDSSSPPAKGLALARMIAMISYRSRESFEQRFGRHRAGHPPAAPWNTDPFADENEFEIQSYLHYQGWKLVQRFDAATYMILSRAMDAHDIGRARGPVEEVLGRISARALCIGIRSDVLYSPEEQREINGAIPRSRYLELDSPHGHDAFLIEFEKLNAAILPFLQDRSPDTEEDLLEAGRTGGTGRRAGGFL